MKHTTRLLTKTVATVLSIAIAVSPVLANASGEASSITTIDADGQIVSNDFVDEIENGNAVQVTQTLIDELAESNGELHGYTPEQLQEGLDFYEEQIKLHPDFQASYGSSSTTSNPLQSRSAIAAPFFLSGSFLIPGVGQVLVICVTAGAIVYLATNYGQQIINSWTNAWYEVSNFCTYFDGIPSGLKGANGAVDLDKFSQKVSGSSVRYRDPKTGWEIEKDTAGHGGSKWKLKNKQGQRKASLDGNGYKLRD